MSSYEFHEDRTTYIREQLLEDKGDGDALKDIVAANFVGYFRMYQKPTASALLLDVTLTTVAVTQGAYPDSGGTQSGLEGYITPTAAWGRVTCRLVLSDTGTDDANTPSGDREYVWKEWTSYVDGSPSS